VEMVIMETASLKIANCLYDYFIGDTDPDMPKDEYINEARAVVDAALLDNNIVETGKVSSLLRNIFVNRFEHDYDSVVFDSIEKDIIDILHKIIRKN
jgi:hypothetical protein